ncbi:hypothetical protein EDEG_00657 [Edhazardia aedis USNM 41457]|uniref:Uncharacterized protein n=1 Tax=Edhazardia aedis (strain USNM 41457) TaxID=1003232 RepID=J9DC20_EDHAE|nr:hypothetical protein EDEG_00657 [Edhazardia aedis USNM 41457]|eukprot:EJW05281.1 hypothetical protein EDEG_00657 [Edhazardia aedis USNM 41457]
MFLLLFIAYNFCSPIDNIKKKEKKTAESICTNPDMQNFNEIHMNQETPVFSIIQNRFDQNMLQSDIDIGEIAIKEILECLDIQNKELLIYIQQYYDQYYREFYKLYYSAYFDHYYRLTLAKYYHELYTNYCKKLYQLFIGNNLRNTL